MIKDIIRLFKTFYRARPVYSVLVGIVLLSLTLGAVGLDVLFNQWRSVFWTAAQAKDIETVVHQTVVFIILAFTAVGVYTAISYLSQIYCLEWRKELCTALVVKWVSLGSLRITIESPDQRIAEDTAKFVSLFSSLFRGLLSAILTLGLFIPILASIGSHLATIYTIPGGWWLPLVCVSLTALGFGITSFLGKSIPSLENNNQVTEADYRYEMVHIRDGHVFSKSRVGEIWDNLYNNHVRLFKKSRDFNIASSIFFQAMVIVPIFCVLPSYFQGLVVFGVIMSCLDAFGKVSSSLSWYLDNFLSIASFKATLIRLTEFDKVLDNSSMP